MEGRSNGGREQWSEGEQRGLVTVIISFASAFLLKFSLFSLCGSYFFLFFIRFTSVNAVSQNK